MSFLGPAVVGQHGFELNFSTYSETKKAKKFFTRKNRRLSYVSGQDLTSNNNYEFKDYSGKAIECRQLAWAFLCQKETDESYHTQFASEWGMRSNVHLAHNEFDHHQIALRADAYYAFCTADNGLGITLVRTCESLALGQQKLFLLFVETHVLAIIVRYKESQGLGYYVVKLYDPNVTLAHKRLVFNDFADLATLRLEDFFVPSICWKGYMPLVNTGILLCYDHLEWYDNLMHGLAPPPIRANHIIAMEDFKGQIAPEHLLWFGMDFNAISIDSLEHFARFGADEFFAVERDRNLSVLHVALLKNYIGVIKVYVERILNSSRLSSDEKMRLVAAKSEKSVTGLFMALQEGHAESVQVYMEAVLSSNGLSNHQKMTLLFASNHEGAPGLSVALSERRAACVRVYVNTILASLYLTNSQKVQLLMANDASGVPAFFLALQEQCIDTAKAYMEIILSSEYLADHEKTQLIVAKDYEDVSGLFIILEDGATEMVRIYLRMVLVSNLQTGYKMDLLLVTDQGVPGFLAALENNHTETVQTYVAIVLTSSLSAKHKAELLAAVVEDVSDYLLVTRYVRGILTFEYLPQGFAMEDLWFSIDVYCEFIQHLMQLSSSVALSFVYAYLRQEYAFSSLLRSTLMSATKRQVQRIQQRQSLVSWETVAWFGLLSRSGGLFDEYYWANQMMNDARAILSEKKIVTETPTAYLHQVRLSLDGRLPLVSNINSALLAC